MSKHIRGAFPELSDLFAAGEAMEALVASFGWVLVVDVLHREIAAESARLEQSQPLSQAEYAMAHGRIAGLKGAEAALGAIVEAAEKALQEQRDKHEGDAGSSPEGQVAG